MTEENFSPQESLRLIQSMIEKTKENISGKSHYFLLWGWLCFVASLGQFFLKHVFHYEKHYLVWWVIVVGFVVSIYFGIRESRNKKVKTFLDESMRYLWTGMSISFFVLAVLLTKMGWGSTVFPFYIMLYGLGTYVSGRFLKFKPFVIGGVLAWMISIITIYLSYDYQILAGCAAMLASYIIPGHLLRMQNQAK